MSRSAFVNRCPGEYQKELRRGANRNGPRLNSRGGSSMHEREWMKPKEFAGCQFVNATAANTWGSAWCRLQVLLRPSRSAVPRGERGLTFRRRFTASFIRV